MSSPNHGEHGSLRGEVLQQAVLERPPLVAALVIGLQSSIVVKVSAALIQTRCTGDTSTYVFSTSLEREYYI